MPSERDSSETPTSGQGLSAIAKTIRSARSRLPGAPVSGGAGARLSSTIGRSSPLGAPCQASQGGPGPVPPARSPRLADDVDERGGGGGQDVVGGAADGGADAVGVGDRALSPPAHRARQRGEVGGWR